VPPNYDELPWQREAGTGPFGQDCLERLRRSGRLATSNENHSSQTDEQVRNLRRFRDGAGDWADGGELRRKGGSDCAVIADRRRQQFLEILACEWQREFASNRDGIARKAVNLNPKNSERSR
jgi:hypothetical protein